MFSSLGGDDGDDLGFDIFGKKRRDRKIARQKAEIQRLKREQEYEKEERERLEKELKVKLAEQRVLGKEVEKSKIESRRVKKLYLEKSLEVHRMSKEKKVLSKTYEKFISDSDMFSKVKKRELKTLEEYERIYKSKVGDLKLSRSDYLENRVRSKRVVPDAFKPPLTVYFNYESDFKIPSQMSENQFLNIVEDFRFDFSRKIYDEITKVYYDVLIFAILHRFTSKLPFLLEKCNPTFSQCRAFREAVRLNLVRAVSVMLQDPFVDPSAKGNESLCHACKSGNLEMVKLLLSSDKVVPTEKHLLIACGEGHEKVAEFLIFVAGVAPISATNKVLVHAIRSKRAGVVKVVLSFPLIDPNIPDLAPLKAAFGNDPTDEVSRLIVRLLLTDPRCLTTFEEVLEMAEKGRFVNTLLRIIGKKIKENDNDDDDESGGDFLSGESSSSGSDAEEEMEEIVLTKEEKTLVLKYEHLMDQHVVSHVMRTICGWNFQLADLTLQSLTNNQINEIKMCLDEKRAAKELKRREKKKKKGKKKKKRKKKKKEKRDVTITIGGEDVEIEDFPGDDMEEGDYIRKDKLRNMEIGFQCPITTEIMEDPVILIETGQTYERAAIEEWLSEHNTDPMTRKRLYNKKLISNIVLKSQIDEFKKMNVGDEEI